jgi:uncharacterized protein (TIGR04141 family)
MFDALEKYISAGELAAMDAEVELLEIAGAPAVWIGVQEETNVANWCGDASATTGLDLSYTDRDSGGVLLVGVDGTAYAMSYGTGYLLIPDELKDQRFGLQFLIRRLNADQVSGLVRRRANRATVELAMA